MLLQMVLIENCKNCFITRSLNWIRQQRRGKSIDHLIRSGNGFFQLKKTKQNSTWSEWNWLYLQDSAVWIPNYFRLCAWDVYSSMQCCSAWCTTVRSAKGRSLTAVTVMTKAAVSLPRKWQGQSQVWAVLAKQQQCIHIFKSDARRWTDKTAKHAHAVWHLPTIRQMCTYTETDSEGEEGNSGTSKHANPVCLKIPPRCPRDTVTIGWNV